MKLQSATLAALALFTAPVLAGDVPVTISGTVTQDLYMFGPMGSAQVGDTVTVSFEASVPGVVITPGQHAEYAIDPASLQIDVNGSVGGLFSGPTSLTIKDDAPGDELAVSSALTNGDFFTCEFDALTSLFQTVDLALLDGGYNVAAAVINDNMLFTGAGGFLGLSVDFLSIGTGDPIGVSSCTNNPNSSGLPANLIAYGTTITALNDVTLEVTSLPPNQFCYFLNSQSTGFIPTPSSQGILCLTGSIGRYNANIFNSGPMGSGSLVLDLPNTPTPNAPVAILAGETWHFQCWYRDVNPAPTNNFSNVHSLTFL